MPPSAVFSLPRHRQPSGTPHGPRGGNHPHAYRRADHCLLYSQALCVARFLLLASQISLCRAVGLFPTSRPLSHRHHHRNHVRPHFGCMSPVAQQQSRHHAAWHQRIWTPCSEPAARRATTGHTRRRNPHTALIQEVPNVIRNKRRDDEPIRPPGMPAMLPPLMLPPGVQQPTSKQPPTMQPPPLPRGT